MEGLQNPSGLGMPRDLRGKSHQDVGEGKKTTYGLLCFAVSRREPSQLQGNEKEDYGGLNAESALKLQFLFETVTCRL